MVTNNTAGGEMLLTPDELMIFNILLPIISISGLVINVVVIIVIVTDRGMRRTTASIYIVNLAVADILVLIVGVPLWIYQLISKNADPWSCHMTFGLSYATSVVSVITLAIISYDRYHCVMQPFSRIGDKRFAYKVVLIVWFIGTALSVPFFAGWKAVHHPVTAQVSAFCVYTRYFRQEAMAADLVIMVLLIIVSTIFYIKLCKIARLHAALIRKDQKFAENYLKHNNADVEKSKQAKIKGQKVLKATKTLGVVLGTMLMCWMPFLVISIMDVMFDVNFSVFTLKMLGTVTYLNSILNPIIYTFMTRAFKESLTKRLKCFKQKLIKTSLTDLRKCVNVNV